MDGNEFIHKKMEADLNMQDDTNGDMMEDAMIEMAQER